jgi:hypothetical protein
VEHALLAIVTSFAQPLQQHASMAAMLLLDVKHKGVITIQIQTDAVIYNIVPLLLINVFLVMMEKQTATKQLIAKLT